MINLRLSLGLIAVVLSAVTTAFAADNRAIKHDPFARPLLSAAAVTSSESGAKVEEEVPWNPTLTAVMVAGKHSLITIDSVIMKLGEVKDGYRLVQVKDHEAVFKKGKKRVVLAIKIGGIRTGAEPTLSAESTLEIQQPLLRQNKEQGNTP
jgi:hypothetical protein